MKNEWKKWKVDVNKRIKRWKVFLSPRTCVYLYPDSSREPPHVRVPFLLLDRSPEVRRVTRESMNAKSFSGDRYLGVESSDSLLAVSCFNPMDSIHHGCVSMGWVSRSLSLAERCCRERSSGPGAGRHASKRLCEAFKTRSGRKKRLARPGHLFNVAKPRWNLDQNPWSRNCQVDEILRQESRKIVERF